MITNIEKERVMQEYLHSSESAKQLGKKYGFNQLSLRRWFKAAGRLDEYTKKAYGNSRHSTTPIEIKKAAMTDYIESSLSTREVGEKYGLCHRQLRKWFAAEGRLEEFENRARMKMRNSASRPMSVSAKEVISGEKSINWNGGRKLEGNARGYYVLIHRPDHPNARKGGYVAEHRIVVENEIGRLLNKDEVVHHVNLIPSDNRIDNLRTLTNSEHKLVHAYLEVALAELLGDDMQALTDHIISRIREAKLKPIGKHSERRPRYSEGPPHALEWPL